MGSRAHSDHSGTSKRSALNAIQMFAGYTAASVPSSHSRANRFAAAAIAGLYPFTAERTRAASQRSRDGHTRRGLRASGPADAQRGMASATAPWWNARIMSFHQTIRRVELPMSSACRTYTSVHARPS